MEEPVGMMDKADRLLGNGKPRSPRIAMRTIEYDHPFQRIALGDGKIHIVDDGRMPCSLLHRCKGHRRISVANSQPHSPCPVCFMEGDLLALQISLPEYVETIDDMAITSKLVVGEEFPQGVPGDSPMDDICGERR
jgi:hypothetical protein